MFRPIARSHRRPYRRGTSFVLIVVVMLSMFAVIGTGYALLAMREQRLSLARKDEASGSPYVPDPTDTVNVFFASLIYDTETTDGAFNNNAVFFNALRGHSIARSMYGYEIPVNPGNPLKANLAPWSGVGVIHQDATDNTPTGNPPNLWTGLGLTGDRAQFVNNRLVMINGKPVLLDPEYTDHRGAQPNQPLPLFFDPAAPTVRTYISKAAGYSFPDLKDFFMGAVDPTTGQVVVSSFHRDWLFGPLDPLNGQVPSATNPYDPRKNNWVNGANGIPGQGALLTLRPRPAEHPLFPRVPPNADGTFTGDVQNWPGGATTVVTTNPTNGQQTITSFARNDSLWMDLGLPIITLPGNRKVKPLVAPLIVPIDGLFNASAHGNAFGPSPGPGLPGSHQSFAGYGAHEINMTPALGGEAAAVVAGRGTPAQQRNGNNTRAFAPSYPTGFPAPLPPAALFPVYSPVSWNNTGVTFTYPSGGSRTGIPTFTNYQTTNAPVTNHPTLFDPNEWPGDGSASPLRTFPLTDAKRLQRFASTPFWYSQADLAAFAPVSLVGNTPPTFNFAPGYTAPANYAYRLDPAHPVRDLVTPRYYELDRPKLTPNFPSGSLSYQGGGKPSNTAALVPYPSPPPLPAVLPTGPGSDFVSPTQWSNALNALGSVNLNRPLTDYRTDLTKPLSPTNPNVNTPQGLQQYLQANNDRQALANDVFTRLVAALGGAAKYNPTTNRMEPQVPPGPQYDALRYLAQLAANVVDYIDNDDISTPFAWNPNQQSEFVYGVEKPRLVINEVYGEITNAQQDDVAGATPTSFPTKPAEVRFWAELLNPSAGLNNGPIGDGSVPLGAYQIQIRRETRKTGPNGTPIDPNPFGGNMFTTLYGAGSATNPTGSFPPAPDGPDATVTFANLPTPLGNLAPSNGAADGNSNTGPINTGMLLIGPPVASPPKQNGAEYSPQYGVSGVMQNAVQSPPLTQAIGSQGMGYTFDLPAQNITFSSSEFKRHIVLLRRLANPYGQLNDPATPGFDPNQPANPYITVDAMDYVPAFDAVHRGKKDFADRGAYDPAKPKDGYDPITSRFSVGKVQPLAGRATAIVTDGLGNYNDYTVNPTVKFPFTMVLNQTKVQPLDPKTMKPVDNAPLNTFGQHNYAANAAPGGSTFGNVGGVAGLSDTLMTPFDWMVHMDRPLINQIELLHVRDSAAYRVTHQFVTAGGGGGLNYDRGVADWTSTAGAARALELLTVKPYVAGVPHGGRVAGRIAINAVTDQRVVTGLFDAAGGTSNGFDANFVNNKAWGQWLSLRTPVGSSTLASGGSQSTATAYAQSIHDLDPATLNPMSPPPPSVNRPFQGGAPAAAPNGQGAYASGGSEELTALRRNGNTVPALYADRNSKGGLNYPPTQPDGPTYTRAEPLQKVYSNITPVSHTYLVYLTIGYFDVANPNPPTPAGWPTARPSVTLPSGQVLPAQPAPPVPPTLGAEAYLNVPGDMRAKFVAVVDMSNMALNAGDLNVATAPPFFTTLEGGNVYPPPPQPPGGPSPPPVAINVPYTSYSATTNQLFIGSNGTQVPVQGGTPLVIGVGADQQVVTVSQVTDPMGAPTAQVFVTGLTRPAWGGSCVSNVRPGYSGPKPFVYTKSNPVVPYIERLR